MADKEKRLAFIDEEEQELFHNFASLSTEKKILIKGIIIGMELRKPSEQVGERRMAV